MALDLKNIDFQNAFNLIKETNQSFFLTGKAGTGKSTFLKHIVETTSKHFVIVAPTGIAGVNVGGVTIHSFFQFPTRPLLPDDENITVFWKNSDQRKIITAMDTLIIDEVSMVRADLIDAIDYSLRRNGGNPQKPFGGKQVVFVGDIFQLEPVAIRNSGEQKIINEIYGGTYFYKAKVFEKINFFTIEFQKVYRQIDPVFISLLDKVRLKETIQADIDQLNSRVFSEFELNKEEFAITLTTKNDLADIVNSRRLAELNASSLKYTAEISGKFEQSKYPTDPELILKENAQVIFIKNDINKRWINGTIGLVVELTPATIKVKLKDGSVQSVDRRVWQNIKYKYNKEKRKIEQEILGTFKQYPLKLAWAITIHKSQGLTFDRVVIDFGDGTFASGQAYVALSRARSFEGLFLKQKIHSTDIYLDEGLKDFAKSFNNKEIIASNLGLGKTLYRCQMNNDLERIGEIYFKKAVTNLKIGNFKSAFTELLIGFENVSCDCLLSKLLEKNQIIISKSLKVNSINCTINEFDLIRAIFHFFIDSGNFGKEQKGFVAKGLPYINSFLEENQNSEIGHYIKGRILIGVGKYEEAILEMELALSIKESARVHYRLGRLKEEGLMQFGIDHLYQSTLLNPSSSCVNRWFKDVAEKRKIKLTTSRGLLANIFNNRGTNEYRQIINHLLIHGKVELENKAILLASSEFSTFMAALNKDAKLFGIQSNNNEGDDGYEVSYDSYRSNYEKYGGYNGYDDDAIDSAFEGDPTNTWNVD